MEIYFKPHSSRIPEQKFFNFIRTSLVSANHISEDFALPLNFKDTLLDRDEILTSFETDVLLSAKRKKICISSLIKLPAEIRISESISSLSIDYAIQEKGKTFFIEFHELQHRKLPDDRLKPIFSNDLEEFRVPRCLQRFLRDVWRWKYLDNYKIIWLDWFEQNPKAKIDFTTEGKNEFCLAGKFSFEKFLK